MLSLLVSLIALTTLIGFVWTGIQAMRLIFPEREIPLDATARREAARRRGEALPVRARDIVDDLRRRPVRPAMPPSGGVTEGEHRSPAPLVEDLWRRRN